MKLLKFLLVVVLMFSLFGSPLLADADGQTPLQKLEAQVKLLTAQVTELQHQLAIAAQREKQLLAEIAQLKEKVPTELLPGTIVKQTKEWILTFHGEANVLETKYSTEPLKGLQHFQLKFIAGGHPIDIYVSKQYMKQFGQGFAYEEVGDMITAHAKQRNFPTYIDTASKLRLYFYTNEDAFPFEKSSQAYISSEANQHYRLMMNASNMKWYDFRRTLVHELYHYVDFHLPSGQSSRYYRAFSTYWGPKYQNWLMEGAAERSYTYYTYPPNKANNLPFSIPEMTKSGVLKYAFAQGGNKGQLLSTGAYNSFADISDRGSNNYGIYLAFYWYLLETFGQQKIDDYVKYVAMNGEQATTQAAKDAIAIKLLGKTERAILQEWLVEFDYFGGKLIERFEQKTLTVNDWLSLDNPTIPPSIKEQLVAEQKRTNVALFIINFKEWNAEQDYRQMQPFRDNSQAQLFLVGNDGRKIPLNWTKSLHNGFKIKDVPANWTTVTIPTDILQSLSKNVPYKLVVENQHDVYRWQVPADFTVTFN